MPATAESDIQSRVEAFVQEITELVREAALEAVNDALGLEGAPRRKTAGKKRTSRKTAVRATRATSRKSGSRKKRSGAQVQADADRILAHVKANPGVGAEQIAKALRLATKELALPVRKLIADKKLRTEGQRRGTKYFAGTGGRKKAAKRKTAKKKARRKAAKRTSRKAGRKTAKKAAA